MRALENEQTRRRMLGYTPKYQPSLGLWVCADNCVESGSLVSQLNDLSGRGRHFSQASDTKKPARIANARNGHAAISFDGVNDALVTPVLTFAQPLHFFFALSWHLMTSGGGQFIVDGTSHYGCVFHNANDPTIRTYFGAMGPTMAFTSDTWMILDVVLNGASSKVAINGGAQTTGNGGTGSPGGITLGSLAAQSAGNFAQYLLGEFVATTTELTGAARLQMCAYLAAKWGIPLAA